METGVGATVGSGVRGSRRDRCRCGCGGRGRRGDDQSRRLHTATSLAASGADNHPRQLAARTGESNG